MQFGKFGKLGQLGHVGVFGAGLVGRFLGIHLSAAGLRVTLLGRDDSRSPPAQLRAVRQDGTIVRPRPDIAYTRDVDDLAAVDICLVTVKAHDSRVAGQTLASVLRPGAVVVSFQNGWGPARELRKPLSQQVAAGIVSFNLRTDDGATIRQTSRGRLFAEDLSGAGAAPMQSLARSFRHGGLRLDLRRDMTDMIAGKLVLNLSNGVCAATGLGIAAAIESAAGRRCFARCIEEGLQVFRAAGIEPARVGPIPPSLMPRILRLPDALVGLGLRGTVGSDARSSTLQDLEQGKPTEIDHLNGAIVELARRNATTAPANEVVTELVHRHERALSEGRPPAFVTPAILEQLCDQAEQVAPLGCHR